MTLKYPDLSIDVPYLTYPYILEKNIRSIEHAQQYLEEKVFLNYLMKVLKHVLILTFLLYALIHTQFGIYIFLINTIMYFILSTLIGYLGVLILNKISYFWGYDSISHIFIFFICLPPIIGFLSLLFSSKMASIINKDIGLQLVAIGSVFVILPRLINLIGVFLMGSFFEPSTLSVGWVYLYSINIICLLSIFLHHNSQYLPKQT